MLIYIKKFKDFKIMLGHFRIQGMAILSKWLTSKNRSSREKKIIVISLTCSRSGYGREVVKGLVCLLEGSSEFVTRLVCCRMKCKGNITINLVKTVIVLLCWWIT